MSERYWTCRRQRAGLQCGTHNSMRKRKCRVCGGHRPKRKRPAHLVALETPYADVIELNGGERCAICGTPPKTRRLNRDHDHRTAEIRGLLCSRCNRALPNWITPGWLREAADYLDRQGPGAA